MNSSKVLSFALTLAIGVIVCVFSTACTFDSSKSGISINKQSRFQTAQNQSKNPRIVYLGSTDNYASRTNFGPKDVDFDIERLK